MYAYGQRESAHPMTTEPKWGLKYQPTTETREEITVGTS